MVVLKPLNSATDVPDVAAALKATTMLVEKVAVWVKVPDCAVTVIVEGPAVAVLLALTFNVTLPDADTEDDVSEATALPDAVCADNVTGPLNPLANVTLTCPLVAPPWTMELSVLPDPNVKGGVTVKVTEVLAVSDPDDPVNWMVPPLVTLAGIVATKLAVVVPAGTVTLLGVTTTPPTPPLGETTTAPLKPVLAFTVTTIGTDCPEKPETEPPLRVKGVTPKAMLPDPGTAIDPPCAVPEKPTATLLPVSVLETLAVNVAEVDPAATVAEAGDRVTPGEDDGVMTTAPLNPEERFTETVTVLLPPGNVLVPNTPSENPATGAMFTVAVCVSPLAVPVKVRTPDPVAVTVY